MFEVRLFLGFPVDPLFAVQMEKVNPHLLGQYVTGSGDHLKEITHNGMKFLGKSLDKTVTVSQLELLESNIYSVLRKLVPEYPYGETPLYLFPVKA